MRPRVEDLGGDLSRVHVLTAIRGHEGTEYTFSLSQDLPLLEAKIVETDAVLVTIDPFSAYLGKTDSHKDSDIRRVLTPLAALTERTDVAVLALMHITKDDKRRAVSRGLGSMAFVAASRGTLAVGRDPGDKDPNGRRIVAPVKSNLLRPFDGPFVPISYERYAAPFFRASIAGFRHRLLRIRFSSLASRWSAVSAVCVGVLCENQAEVTWIAEQAGHLCC